MKRDAFLGAVYANTFVTIARDIKATGIRTSGLKSRGVFPPHASRSLAESFLVNTKLRRGDSEAELSTTAYFGASGIALATMLDSCGSGQLRGEIPLSKQKARLGMDLDSALRRRRSARQFTGDAMGEAHFAKLIAGALGYTRVGKIQLPGDAGEVEQRLRNCPSGGGLYPIEGYVLTLCVRGIPRSLWHFDPRRERLLPAGSQDSVGQILRSFAVSDENLAVTKATAIIFLVARPWRSMRKYGDRGLRYIFIEAGEIAQAIHLITAALGYGSVDCASYYDDEIHQALGIDGLSDAVVHCVIIGSVG
jgi:SagB-type dehydrogenase family enzyme